MIKNTEWFKEIKELKEFDDMKFCNPKLYLSLNAEAKKRHDELVEKWSHFDRVQMLIDAIDSLKSPDELQQKFHDSLVYGKS